MVGMYDPLFVNLAQELDLPILTSDMRLSRAARQTMRMERLRGIGPASQMAETVSRSVAATLSGSRDKTAL